MINKEKFFNEIKDSFGIVIEIINTKNKENKIFSILEGKDNVYYYHVIDQENKNEYEIINLHAGCKINVLDTYELIRLHNLIKKHDLKILFFIDKDFDDNYKINTEDIYITKGYSFENFYTNQDTFVKICKNNLFYFDKDILENFKTRKKEFHNLVEIVNQCRKYFIIKKKKKTFDDLKNSKIVDIKYNKINNITQNGIEEYLSDNYFGGKGIPKVVKKIKFGDKNNDFRGKDEIDFFLKFLNETNLYIKQNGLREKGYKPIGINESCESFLDRASKYAEIPTELKEYIKSKI